MGVPLADWDQPELIATLAPLLIASLSRGASDAVEFEEDPEEWVEKDQEMWVGCFRKSQEGQKSEDW